MRVVATSWMVRRVLVDGILFELSSADAISDSSDWRDQRVSDEYLRPSPHGGGLDSLGNASMVRCLIDGSAAVGAARRVGCRQAARVARAARLGCQARGAAPLPRSTPPELESRWPRAPSFRGARARQRWPGPCGRLRPTLTPSACLGCSSSECTGCPRLFRVGLGLGLRVGIRLGLG